MKNNNICDRIMVVVCIITFLFLVGLIIDVNSRVDREISFIKANAVNINSPNLDILNGYHDECVEYKNFTLYHFIILDRNSYTGEIKDFEVNNVSGFMFDFRISENYKVSFGIDYFCDNFPDRNSCEDLKIRIGDVMKEIHFGGTYDDSKCVKYILVKNG